MVRRVKDSSNQPAGHVDIVHTGVEASPSLVLLPLQIDRLHGHVPMGVEDFELPLFLPIECVSIDDRRPKEAVVPVLKTVTRTLVATIEHF
jgi:hypothetical protein